MKKNWKIVAMVALMMAWLCLFTAEAEVKIYAGGTNSIEVGTWSNGDTIWEEHYFAKVKSDKGTETEIEITEEEYKKLRPEIEETKFGVYSDPNDQSWFKKAVSWVTFWNPND